jgi:hypothetical protein
MRVLWQILAAFNPAELWRALREAEDGVCLMAPVPVRSERRQRRR